MSIIRCDLCDTDRDSDFIDIPETLKGMVCEKCYCSMTQDEFDELFDEQGEPRKVSEDA